MTFFLLICWIRTRFIAERLQKIPEPAWSAPKGDEVRGGIVDWVNKQKARGALDRLKDHEARR